MVILTNETRLAISGAARSYCEEHGITCNQLQKMSDCSYVSYILKGELTRPHPKTKAQEPIKDIYFEKVAETIGFRIEKEYWPTVATSQFKEIVVRLDTAKKGSMPCTLIGETGCGKSYAIEQFKKKNPRGTYVTICNDLFKPADLLDAIMDSIGIPTDQQPANPVKKLKEINIFLSRRAAEGLKPILILDEAENMKIQPIKSIKSIYDTLIGTCAIVLIGTDELKRKMDKLKNKKNPADGIPQFYRRFMVAHLHKLDSIDLSFRDFLLENTFIKDRKLKSTLQALCNDYGSLHDYLEPAIREAERMKQPLTDEFFRSINKI